MQGIGSAAAVSAVSNEATPQPRLVRAAHEFEAQMMKELLKPMTDSDGVAGEDDDSGSGSGGAMGEFASEALGRALSDQGGLGIAKSILNSISQAGTRSHSGTRIENHAEGTRISRRK
ncbi:MAG: hypothetical protein WAM85_22670 [Terracidiphilus sp.]